MTAFSAWHGSVVVAKGSALYMGPAGDTRAHRHHALQLVVALEAPFEAQIEDDAMQPFGALLIAADCRHRIEGKGLPLAIYYVDRSCDEGRALTGWLRGTSARSLATHSTELRTAMRTELANPSALHGLRQHLAEIFQCASSTAAGDPAVASATELLEGCLGSSFPVSELARRVGLRQRDLSARFRTETGLTIRRYMLWVRLKAAVSELAESKTLTEAAHTAGFADAAHLSRTFVEMFGVAPSASVAASEIQILEKG